jgi:exodeoxyribonuclease VIII
MLDLMIDLETLGTGTDAVIVSIGACYFDIHTGETGDKFYEALNITNQLAFDRKIDPSTLSWWMGQSEEARKVFTETSDMDIRSQLEMFCEWIRVSGSNSVHVWGNGSSFDISILEHALNQFGIEIPWKYSNVMDLRTFRRFVANNEKVTYISGHHNALSDATNQALFVLKHVKGNQK